MYSPNSKYWQIPDVAIVRPAKKALPYTITTIGDAKALAAWKKDQAMLAEARDLYLKPIREATRLRAAAMVANQNADTSLDAVSKAEIEHRQVRKGATLGKVDYTSAVIPEALQKDPNFMEALQSAVKRFWKSAFPDNS